MEQLQSASDESISEKSDLIPIFEAMSIKDRKCLIFAVVFSLSIIFAISI